MVPTTAVPIAQANHNYSVVSSVPRTITDEWGLPAVVLFGIFMVVFIVVGFVGNLLVMTSIALFKEFRGRSMYFIFNLAVTDLLTSGMAMPLALTTLVSGRWPFSDAVCTFNGFATELCFIATMHTLMYISIYRFVCINDPLNKGRLNKWAVAAMLAAPWIWAAIMCGASFNSLGSYDYVEFTTQCDPEFPKTAGGFADLWLTMTTCFIVPLVVMLVMYTLILFKARKHLQRLKLCSNIENKAFEQQQRLATTFFMILIAFIFCWCPLMIYTLYSSYVKDTRSLPWLANPIVYWLSYANSAINPVLYSLRLPVLRALVRRMCGLKPFTETNAASDTGRQMHAVKSHQLVSGGETETPFL